VSLNTELIVGPDLLTSIIGILIRFREGPVAVSADIEAMFSLVTVPSAQQSLLRWLFSYITECFFFGDYSTQTSTRKYNSLQIIQIRTMHFHVPPLPFLKQYANVSEQFLKAKNLEASKNTDDNRDPRSTAMTPHPHDTPHFPPLKAQKTPVKITPARQNEI
jgi:hypothetical protein